MGVSYSKNLVSIITPLYNCERFVQDTINSIIEQTYTNWELFLIDDCSNDNTLSIVESVAKEDRRIKIIRLKRNSGAAIARNEGIKYASGKYIAFLDSDDLWKPYKLERQLYHMQKRDLPFTYTSYERINEDGSFRGVVEVPAKVSYKELLNTCVIGCLTVIYNVEQLGKMYMPDIRKSGEYGLWMTTTLGSIKTVKNKGFMQVIENDC